jgi:hypothetical protein
MQHGDASNRASSSLLCDAPSAVFPAGGVVRGATHGHNTVIAAAIAAAKPSAAVMPCRFDQQTDAQCAAFLRY